MNRTIDDYLSEHNRLIVSASPDHCLNTCSREFGSGFYYRGMGDVRYELISSLDRADASATHMKYCGEKAFRFREQWYQREFRKVAHNHLSASSMPSTRLEWLAVMQHYGVPTRLIDLTRSPFIALYFAVRNWQSNTDAVVWAIGHERLHKSSFHRLQVANFPYPVHDPDSYANEMQEFLNDQNFSAAFMSGKYEVAMILNPHWASTRLAAQQGAFLVSSAVSVDKTKMLVELIEDDSHMDPHEAKILKEQAYDISIRKLVIPSDQKKGILKQLHRMNISASTLFPGIEGTAGGITEVGILEDWESAMEEEI